MILNALVKRYEDTGAEHAFGWQKRRVDFALNLDEDGRVLDIIDLRSKKGSRTDKPSYTVPLQETRTSGVLPYFLCDNADYLLFGGNNKKWQAAAELHTKILKNARGTAARAIMAHFAAQTPPIKELEENGVYLFMVEGRRAIEDEEIKRAWEEYLGSLGKGDRVLDLVSGLRDELEEKHLEIALPGVTMGKKPLISINNESFTSYGKTKDDPAAQMGKQTCFKYATALNALLADEKHRQSIGRDTLVYWAEENGEEENECINMLANPQQDDSEKLRSIMLAVREGKPVFDCRMERGFCLLCLSPNAGRISVRFFLKDSFGGVIKNLTEHYDRLELYSSRKENFPYIPPWLLLSETTVSGKAADAAPLLGGQFMRAILSNGRYPMTLYNAMLQRIRSGGKGGGVTRARVAVIKATILKNMDKESEAATVSLNTQTSNKAYVLGRLFSVLEQLQESAGNKGLRERYFAGACANPAGIFPTILRLSMHHAAKSDYSARYEKLKEELLGKLDVEETP
jgi:CRISPR-associated protein Csd1